VIETPAWVAMSRIVARPFGFSPVMLWLGRKLAPGMGLPKVYHVSGWISGKGSANICLQQEERAG
jgi:hypothetical protein